MTATIIISALDKLGKGIILREFIALFGCVICLVTPIMGYEIYNRENTLSHLWGRYMPIAKDIYFGYALPATAAFVLTITWPLNKRISDEGISLSNLLVKAREKLILKPLVGIYLVIIGVVMFAIVDVVPSDIRYLITLFYFASFAGILYIYFTPHLQRKKFILLLFLIFIVANALRGGMFTVVVYMGITIFSFFFLNRKVSLWKKIAFFLVGVFMLILIQSVKQSFRRLTWKQNYEGNKGALFGKMLLSKLDGSVDFFSPEAFFPIYYRTNQGFNIAKVMNRIPNLQPYDGGNNLMRTFASSLVPRVLWPGKPEAGGKENMKYYAGLILRGWSTNVGPLGEAYGSFGVTGGIIYMFMLGMFIRWAYVRVFTLAQKNPLIIFWIPVLFYQITYSAESDTLQILNSLFKASFFIWILYITAPDLFGVRRNVRSRRVPVYKQNPV